MQGPEGLQRESCPLTSSGAVAPSGVWETNGRRVNLGAYPLVCVDPAQLPVSFKSHKAAVR